MCMPAPGSVCSLAQGCRSGKHLKGLRMFPGKRVTCRVYSKSHWRCWDGKPFRTFAGFFGWLGSHAANSNFPEVKKKKDDQLRHCWIKAAGKLAIASKQQQTTKCRKSNSKRRKKWRRSLCVSLLWLLSDVMFGFLPVFIIIHCCGGQTVNKALLEGKKCLIIINRTASFLIAKTSKVKKQQQHSPAPPPPNF